MTTRALTMTGTTALITGASSGLGVGFATEFARRGADLVLVARREDRLRDVAGRLTADHGVSAITIAADLADPASVPRLRAELDEREITVSSLVNNAGFGMKGQFAGADLERTLQMVQLDVTTVVSLTREFLPDLQRAGHGVLINVGSTAAYQPCPTMAVYAASKAFVLSFTEAIAYEARGTGVRVLCVSPGATRTEFFDVVGDEQARVGAFETPEQVVATTMRSLDQPDGPASVVSGRRNAITAKLVTLLPRRLALQISGRALRAERA